MVTLPGSPPNPRDVGFDPLQRGDHVHQAVVARRSVGFLGEVRGGQKPEHAEPVVDGDQDDALERQEVAIVARLGTCSAGESAAVNPEHHRQLALVGCVGRRVDVEKEAILAGGAVQKDHIFEDAALGAVRAVLGGVAIALPLGRGLRRFPAQVADRRRGVRQAQKRFHLAVIDGLSVNFALFCFDCERIGMSERVHSQHKIPRPGHTKPENENASKIPPEIRYQDGMGREGVSVVTGQWSVRRPCDYSTRFTPSPWPAGRPSSRGGG